MEIVSPGSLRPDTGGKPDEYAEAGIEHHWWLVDLNEPVSLSACHLAGELGYQDAPEMTGQAVLETPFVARLDLSRLPTR